MVSSRPRPMSTNGILLVEGRDDEHVVLHLCHQHSSFSVEGESGNWHIVLNTPRNQSFSVLPKPREVTHNCLQALETN